MPKPEAALTASQVAGNLVPGLALIALLAAGVIAPGLAAAQGATGAERYEVTITPPKRPGSPGAEAESAASVATPGAAPGAAPGDSGESAPEAAAQLSPPGSPPAPAAVPVPGAQDAAPSAAVPLAAATDAAGALATAPARTAPADGPVRTLQVGAFRQRASASELAAKLEGSFPDVTLVEVQSGGEALYRVIVGRLPRGAALGELKTRLAAAGYPAFEVVPPPAAN